MIVSHLPPAPKYHDEIKEILDEGLVKDEGAFVVEATGTKDGKKVMVETYLYAPGCEETLCESGHYRRAVSDRTVRIAVHKDVRKR